MKACSLSPDAVVLKPVALEANFKYLLPTNTIDIKVRRKASHQAELAMNLKSSYLIYIIYYQVCGGAFKITAFDDLLQLILSWTHIMGSHIRLLQLNTLRIGPSVDKRAGTYGSVCVCPPPLIHI